ncbi:glycosyl hydrolase [Persicobacter diffluens]|uniref:GH16 domain-containing protein n=1 Tax=Persicobacter diffluens TaxID=981 RepID=A0AAN4W3J6_9BACT|nr:hypothetical protein PEDI_41840 [Persicobacter diffluens]
MKRFFVLLVLVVVNVSYVLAQPYFLEGKDPLEKGKKWQKVEALSDEFEGKKVDLEKWQIEPEGNGWMWIGRPPGLFESKNVSVKKGKLKVEVSKLKKEQHINGRDFKYTGAIVRSIEPGQPGWYYEARMKANATEMSSTFWLMTNNKDCQKKLELDIQECVGVTSDLTHKWAKNWDQIYHSNAIHRKTNCNPEPTQMQASVKTEVANHERYFVYGAWWKSPEEILFYLDGEYQYTIKPSTPFDMPAWIQMAIETYDWNPVPEDGGMVASGNKAERTTSYDWVRVWEVVDDIAQ